MSKTLYSHSYIPNIPSSLYITACFSIFFNESSVQLLKHCTAILTSQCTTITLHYCLVQYFLQWEFSTVRKKLYSLPTIPNIPPSLYSTALLSIPFNESSAQTLYRNLTIPIIPPLFYITALCSIPFSESSAQRVKHCTAILSSPIYHNHFILLHCLVFSSMRAK